MKIFGIPVRVSFTFWLLVLFLGYNRILDPQGMSPLATILELGAVVFGSVLFHELGHAFVGRGFGLVPQIQLYGMGGLTSWEGGRWVSPKKSIIISFAGPGANFLLGGIVIGLWMFAVPPSQKTQFAQVTFSDLMFVNFGWGVLNLLPILPLDGGHITAGFEEIITKRQDMTATMIISIMTAIVLGIYAFAKGSIGLFGIEADGRFFAFFALLMAIQNVNLLMHRSDTRSRPVVAPPREAPRKTAWNTAAKPNSRSGIEGAKKAVERARSSVERRQAMEMLVRAYVQSGDFPQARRELNNLQSVFGVDDCLEGYYLLQSGQTERAIAHLKDAFARDPDPKVGNMLTHALLSEKRFEEALELASDPSLSRYASSLFKTIQSDAYTSGQYELSARAGDLAFRKDRDPAAAYNVACALGRLSRIDEAVMWVSAALDAGFPDVSLLSLDPDMAPLKGHPEFQRLLKSKAS